MVKELTLSVCDFPDQFTCNSGDCIDIFKRCDNKKDCGDGSDEKSCQFMRIPPSYEKSLPPENLENIGKPNQIFPNIKINRVDFVNTVDMVVGLTIKLTLKWKDYHVKFENIKSSPHEKKASKRIPMQYGNQLWLPHENLIFQNATLGDIRRENLYLLEVEVTKPATAMNPEESRETLIYPGTDSWLILTQRVKLKYPCNFELANFPFDKSICKFALSLDMTENNILKLMGGNQSVVYAGPKILNEFKITSLESDTWTNDKETSFIFTIHFERLYWQYLLTAFLQSFLFLVLAYLTLFIDLSNFNNRFMGSLTCLLVLVALLSHVTRDVPKTAYFKNIDVWYNWFIINIFTIILVHVLVDSLHKNETQVLPMTDKKLHKKKSKAVNTICKIIIPTCNIVFIISYFALSINV